MDLPLSDLRRMAVEEFDTTKLLAHASKQAAERGYKNFPIVDVDSHHYEIGVVQRNSRIHGRPGAAAARQSASQTGMRQGVGVVPSGVGYQDMGGRVTRYALRGIEKTEPAIRIATSR